MVNSSNVKGTSTPRCRSPKGRAAENNKWKCPLRIKPTSPILVRTPFVGAGSLGMQDFRFSDIARTERGKDALPQGITATEKVHLSIKVNLKRRGATWKHRFKNLLFV